MEAVREAIMVERSRVKRQRIEQAPASDLGAFEGAALLPQELILPVLAAVSASADKPADFFSAMLTCKKFMKLGEHRQVRKVASALCVAVRAARWCVAAHDFLRSCGDAGNPDANYLLSMILFYCLAEGHQGWSRMMKPARSSHAESIYALAIIRLNGSGGITVDDRGQHAAAHLCKAAANLGHIGALCELGNCVSRCLGVPKNIANGRRLTLRANLQELCAKYPPGPALEAALAHIRSGNCPKCITSDFECFAVVPSSYTWSHPANSFLAEWFAARPLPPPPAPMLLMYSMPTCGRPETQPLEFRRCTVCSIVPYCSYACQVLHGRMGPKQ